MVNTLTHIGYFAVIVLLVSMVPPNLLGQLDGGAQTTIIVVGALGIWRYTWAITNYTRAVIYRLAVYPRRKAKAFRKYAAQPIKAHAYFMITSFMVSKEDTLKVYRRLFLAASKSENGATICSSVVTGSDERFIRQIYQTMPYDMSRVRLIIDRIPSKGKRDAMAKALKILADLNPTRRDICVFVDGDTLVPEDIVAQSAPMFSNPRVGALTTDEACIIEKKNLFRDWFVLRFNQRQVMMSSVGLGRHVLTLTGRMSIFRGDLATNPGFIRGVEHDYLNHWRLGHIKFLTGDDKSTWYWLLKNGYEMAYLPDVRSESMETQPRPTFFASARTLMVRWYGNMLRTNGRALKLSPRLIGPFTWWSILDQRLSMWTTLVGPISVIVAAISSEITIIPLYLAWVMFTRYVMVAAISINRGEWFPITHPPILYFSQIFGAATKTFVSFRMNKQRWTRQNATAVRTGEAVGERIQAIDSTVHHALALSWLTVAIIFVNIIW